MILFEFPQTFKGQFLNVLRVSFNNATFRGILHPSSGQKS